MPAVRTVAAGEAFLDPKVAARVSAWTHRTGSVGTGERLTEREIAVLRLAASGASNREIAEAMFLTENTVRTYLRRVMTKLGCHSRGEAAVRAARLGWL